MKCLRQAVIFNLFFANFTLNSTAYAAPKIPQPLLDNSLVYCTSVSGFSFNPQKADIGTNMNVVTEQIYDKLFEFEDNQLKPALAERYEISADGRTITLYLRKKVAFHQTAWFAPTRYFNAEDVLFSLKRVMGDVDDLPALNAGNHGNSEFSQAQNRAYQQKANVARYPYFESIALKSKIASISAPNSHTVKIELFEPDNSLLAHLASQYAVMLSKEYALQLNADENLPQLDLLPVGTGVYQLKSYTQNNYVRLEPNPHYWGKKANIANMVVDFSSDGTGRMAKFLNRECDVVAYPEPSQLSSLASSLAKHPNFGRVIETNGANLAYLAFNMQKPAMQERDFRFRIARAINRQRLAKQLFYGKADVAQNVLPPTLYGELNYGSYPYALLSEEERKTSAKSDRLQFWVVDEKRIFNQHPLKMAELIRTDLEKAGIEVQIKAVSRAYLVQQIVAGKADYDLILSGWLANNLDPNGVLVPLLSCKTQQEVTNLANWCNEEFDHWLELAEMSKNHQARHFLYRLSQHFLEQELPLLPLLNSKRILLVNDKVAQVGINPFGQVKLSEIKLKMTSEKAEESNVSKPRP